jgi:hypothetical protein
LLPVLQRLFERRLHCIRHYVFREHGLVVVERLVVVLLDLLVQRIELVER